MAYLHLGRWREAAEMRDRGLAADPEYDALKTLTRHFLGLEAPARDAEAGRLRPRGLTPSALLKETLSELNRSSPAPVFGLLFYIRQGLGLREAA